MSLTNHLDHFEIYSDKPHKLNQQVFTLPQRLVGWKWRASDAFAGIFHFELPYSGIKNQPKRAFAL